VARGSRLDLPIVYSPRYELDLGGHIWPTSKYRLVASRLTQDGAIDARSLIEPEACSWDDLALVHTADYLSKVKHGTLSAAEIQTLELPWVPGLADGFRLMVGGTIRAAGLAIERGAAAHLGGGLHHAFPNHGEGFCLFNDVAVAVRRLQRDRRVARAAIVDCDVHHGNGTAFIFERDPSVFTFSIHQQHNYPAFKPASDLDIGLEDGTGDAVYLGRLREALKIVLDARPEVLAYLAGSDPYERDRLGGLALTVEGLRARDCLVFDAAREAGIPVFVVLAGGYAEDVQDTVQIHANTVAEAARVVRLTG
jgi:acetoin utilization deacetylase AcuC-like enzyme